MSVSFRRASAPRKAGTPAKVSQYVEVALAVAAQEVSLMVISCQDSGVLVSNSHILLEVSSLAFSLRKTGHCVLNAHILIETPLLDFALRKSGPCVANGLVF